MKILVSYAYGLLVLLCATSICAQELVPGNVIGRHIYGLATDINGDPLITGKTPLIFSEGKFNQILNLDEMEFVVSGFGDMLGGLYLTRYDTESKRYVDTVSFELDGVDGLSNPRGGIVTAWNSVLFGEAQLIDAENPKVFVDNFKDFYKGKGKLVNPYNYGWIGEAILLGEQGNAKIIKNYAAGRVFASQLFMMPDNRSLYLFDRENSGLIYLYIAEEANSLTNGTLYSISLDNGKVVYSMLGHSSALKMKFKLKRITFDNLFDTATVKAGNCPDKYTYISTVYGEECLKVKRRNKKYAGLLEPIRMQAIQQKGNSLTKFRKVEFGINNNKVLLELESGLSATYLLGRNADLDSQYIIRE